MAPNTDVPLANPDANDRQETQKSTLTAEEAIYDANGDGVLDDDEKMVMAYDVDGDGQLDEVEKKMLEMDKTKSGRINNAQVYNMMKEQMNTQKELFNMKRMMLGLSVFTLILALSNLGTAFAAARLAKDTTVDKNGAMTNKATGQSVATREDVEHVPLIRIEDPERLRELSAECGQNNNGNTNCGNGNNNQEDVFELSFDVAKAVYLSVDSGIQETLTLNCRNEVQKSVPLKESGATLAVSGLEAESNYLLESSYKENGSYTFKFRSGDIKFGPCGKNGKCQYNAQKSEYKC